MSGRNVMFLLLVVWAFFYSSTALVSFPGAQSFVLVPSLQQYFPHVSSSSPAIRRRSGCNICSTATTALFVRSNSSGDPNPAFAINKKLVELGKKKQWRELLEVAKEEQASFNNVNYSTIMSQLGRIRSLDRSDPRFLTFLRALATIIDERGLPWIQARSASNIIHAIGKMKLRNSSSKRILGWISTPKIAERFVEDGNPHDIANVAWACATLGFDAPNLFAEIEHRSKWLVEEGKPQAVANTALACATLGFEAPKFFAEIDHRSKWLVDEGNPQEVANTALACAKLGLEAPNLFAEIERRSKWLVEEGDPQNVANTAWACAKLGFEAPNLFAEIERRSEWLVDSGNPQDVSSTAWACAKLNHEAPMLFAEIERRSKWFVENGNSQDIAMMKWACATLKFQATKLLKEIERKSK